MSRAAKPKPVWVLLNPQSGDFLAELFISRAEAKPYVGSKEICVKYIPAPAPKPKKRKKR